MSKTLRYIPDREVGLHYQIHRGIGIHHTRAIEATNQTAQALKSVRGPEV